jgi:hypothetical protein
MPKIVIFDDVIVSERVGYALMECRAGCQSFLLINAKDFGYTSNWCCSTCIDK